MKRCEKISIAGLLLIGLFLALPARPLRSAPPIQSEGSLQEQEAAQKEKEEKKKDSPEEKKQKEEEKKLKKTLSQIRRRLEKDEKKLRVRANLFTSHRQVSDCTAADKARARLDDVGDEGGIIVKEDLNISSHNEAEIGKNEGSITNVTEVNIINEINKRC